MSLSGSRLRHDSQQVSPDPFLELGLGSLFPPGKSQKYFLGYIYNLPRLSFTAYLQLLGPEK